MEIMLCDKGRRLGITVVAVLAAFAGMVASASGVAPSETDARTPAASSASTDPVTYQGSYRVSPLDVMTVSFAGKNLLAQLNGRPVFSYIPSDGGGYYSAEGGARITLVSNAQGQPTGIQIAHGQRIVTAERVTAAQGQQIADYKASRIAAQKPFPGSDDAVKRILNDDESAVGFSPELVALRSRQASSRKAYEAELGAVSSYEFEGVSGQGWDKYLVRRSHGTEEVQFMLDQDGVIVGAARYR